MAAKKSMKFITPPSHQAGGEITQGPEPCSGGAESQELPTEGAHGQSGASKILLFSLPYFYFLPSISSKTKHQVVSSVKRKLNVSFPATTVKFSKVDDEQKLHTVCDSDSQPSEGYDPLIQFLTLWVPEQQVTTTARAVQSWHHHLRVSGRVGPFQPFSSQVASPNAPTLVCHEDLPIRAHSLFLSLSGSDPLRGISHSSPCHSWWRTQRSAQRCASEVNSLPPASCRGGHKGNTSLGRGGACHLEKLR
ncbi:hypothetical protein U0070_021454 [Myodes glareolus]|uniref:Uncharacterized protein n=1 Tax=Myodes glareolus TaxID=447135 RepID=A0AAW0JDC1_MYOGA